LSTKKTDFLVEIQKQFITFAQSEKADKGSAGEQPFRNILTL